MATNTVAATPAKHTTLHTLVRNSTLGSDLTDRFSTFLEWCEEACDETQLRGDTFTFFVPNNDSIQLLLDSTGLCEKDARACHKHYMRARAYVTHGLVEAPPYRKPRIIHALNGAPLLLIGQTIQGVTIQSDPLLKPCVNMRWNTKGHHIRMVIHTIDAPYACYHDL